MFKLVVNSTCIFLLQLLAKRPKLDCLVTPRLVENVIMRPKASSCETPAVVNIVRVLMIK